MSGPYRAANQKAYINADIPARQRRRKPPLSGEVAERQRRPEGLWPFALTTNLSLSHLHLKRPFFLLCAILRLSRRPVTADRNPHNVLQSTREPHL